MAHGALLLFELGAVIFALGLIAKLSRRLAISPIPLYLLAGLAIGEGGLFPIVTSEGLIEFGAELGVIFLLLMLGLEYTAEELVSGMKSVAPAGLIDLALNFTPGFAAGLLLGWRLVPALFLGGVTYISSSGVIAKLVNDLGWAGNRETPVVLSILVFEDLAMAVILPILGVLALGESPNTAVLAIGLALVAMAAALAFAYKQGDRLAAFIFDHSDEASLLTVFGITLAVAGLAEGVNISAAVGAFLVGIGVSGAAAEKAQSLLTPLRDLFAAEFFFFFGLSTNPQEIPGVLLVAVLLGLVTAATKVFVGWWAAKRADIGYEGRLRSGLALIARGEFSIIIAGLAAGVAGAEELPALAAGYVLIMAIAGPLLARFVRIGPEAGPSQPIRISDSAPGHPWLRLLRRPQGPNSR